MNLTQIGIVESHSPQSIFGTIEVFSRYWQSSTRMLGVGLVTKSILRLLLSPFTRQFFTGTEITASQNGLRTYYFCVI